MRNRNTEEKSLTVIRENGIFGKIRKFFQSIFSGKKQTYEYIEDNFVSNQSEQKRKFMALDDIEIKFQEFREGRIREKDLTKQEREKIARYIPRKDRH